MTHNEIHKICKRYNIKKYIINDDMSIDVDGNVYLSSKNLTKLPLKFNKVSGNFSCFYNKIKTLEGSPKEVMGYFDCSKNNLNSLKGAPLKIGSDFYCYGNSSILDYGKYLKNYLNRVKRINKLKDL